MAEAPNKRRQPVSLRNMHASSFIATLSSVSPTHQLMLNIHLVSMEYNKHTPDVSKIKGRTCRGQHLE